MGSTCNETSATPRMTSILLGFDYHGFEGVDLTLYESMSPTENAGDRIDIRVISHDSTSDANTRNVYSISYSASLLYLVN